MIDGFPASYLRSSQLDLEPQPALPRLTRQAFQCARLVHGFVSFANLALAGACGGQQRGFVGLVPEFLRRLVGELRRARFPFLLLRAQHNGGVIRRRVVVEDRYWTRE